MTLDDLIALNDEIAALVRAGVPLEAGLAELGGDLPGRLGRFAAGLAQRTARGESLAQAITGDAGQLPPAYRAVVEAACVRAGCRPRWRPWPPRPAGWPKPTASRRSPPCIRCWWFWWHGAACCSLHVCSRHGWRRCSSHSRCQAISFLPS